MKKLFLIVIAAIMATFSVSAQVQVESPHPDLDVQVKRCSYASGTVIIDLLLTNYGRDEKVRIYGGSYMGGSTSTVAYDDEGNQYEHHAIRDNTFDATMSTDIPMKHRVTISNVDPYATKFTIIKLDIESRGEMGIKSRINPITIRNLSWAK